MNYSKKTRIQPLNSIVIPSKHESNNPVSGEKKTSSSKKRYIAATLAGGLCLCILLATVIVVPLVYSLHISKNETTTITGATTINTTSAITTTVTIVTTTTSNNGIGLCGSNSTLVTFDDLNGLTLAPNGYNNIKWTNAGVLKAPSILSGYYTGTVSGNYTSNNLYGNPMIMNSTNGSYITLYSAAVAAAWYNNLQFTVVGYNSNVVIVNTTFTLQVFNISYLTFIGYSGLDAIKFTTSGGTLNSAVGGSGTHYAMDNICLSFT